MNARDLLDRLIENGMPAARPGPGVTRSAMAGPVEVIGAETSPDERTELVARFCPDTVVRPGYEPPDGEVDLLLSNDVLSEGQNLQQAAAVISYDMPWNPQRVVQRYGRVIRLKSPHRRVHLSTTEAARRVVDVTRSYGLRRVEPPAKKEPIEEGDVGVVCWMAVL